MDLHRLKTLVPDHFNRSEYYRTYYMQIGIVDEIGYFVKLEPGGYVVISLGRYRDEKEFGKSAFDAFMEVEPIVRSLVMRNSSDFIFQPNIKADSSADLLESLSQRAGGCTDDSERLFKRGNCVEFGGQCSRNNWSKCSGANVA